MKCDIDYDLYLELKEYLEELYPQIEIRLISSDPMLKALGFVEKIPCTVEILATDEQIEEIQDKALSFELAVYYGNSDRYPNKNDPEYILYLKYECLANFFVGCS